MVRERCELSQICNQIARSQPSGGSLNISDGVPDSLVVVLEDCRRKSRLCYVVMLRGRDGSVPSPVHSDDVDPADAFAAMLNTEKVARGPLL